MKQSKAKTARAVKLIGVDLGGTNVRAALVENNRIVATSASPLVAKDDEMAVIEQICATIQAVMQRGVKGIGLGVPGIVDVAQGIVYTVTNIPSWKKVHLRKHVEERFGLPVFLNNDANCFALGELHFGVGQGYRDLVGLIVGTGMASGLVFDGKLYAGQNCGAGEIGCIPYKDGTIEDYCSGSVFTREYGIEGAALHVLASKGDKKAKKIFEGFGEDFGHAIMTVVYAYDPEIIVLGGSVSQAYPYYEAAMRRKLQSFAYQKSLRRLVITRNRKANMALLGAAALCQGQHK